MEILIRLLMALEVIVCILLIGIVLIQRSKGQGVGLSFGSGAEAIFGAQAGNVVVRATVILGIVFLVNTALLAVLRPTAKSDSIAEREFDKKGAATVQAPVMAPTAEETAAALDALGGGDIEFSADSIAVEPVVEAVVPVAEPEAPAADVEAAPAEAPAEAVEAAPEAPSAAE